MIQNNKLPQKSVLTLNSFKAKGKAGKVSDTDTTTTILTSITSTHIFNK